MPPAPALMCIDFVCSGRPCLEWSGDALRIGSAKHHPVCLQGAGVAVDHAVLRADAGGIWLQVEPGAQRVHVNARPVRECALLRLGDTLSVGGHRMLLRAAGPLIADNIAIHPESVGMAPPAVSLRAVAGPCSGKTWSVHDQLQLDRSGCPISSRTAADDAGLTVGWRDRRLWLDVAADLHGAVSINGMVVDASAQLHNADCIGMGALRFVVDAWALTTDAASEENEDLALDTASPEDSAGPRGEVWWLLLTAAALGLVIALFLLLHH